MSFPRNIFQVWYQGCDSIQKTEFITNIRNWEKMNPNWKYYCLDDSLLSNACKQFSDECFELYQKASAMHIKIDLARYVLIYLYGGIYVDMDAYILRPLETSSKITKLINTYEQTGDHVLGLSRLNVNRFESFLLTGNKQYLNNAIMISSPKNPVLKRYIEYILQQSKSNSWNWSQFFKVNFTTGPLSFNSFFNNTNNTKDSHIFYFPPSTFEPCDLANNCSFNNETVSLHLFELSWVHPFLKYIIQLYYVYKPFILFLLIYILYTFTDAVMARTGSVMRQGKLFKKLKISN
jgi:mannosyltransferase OCH1-like enzyme